MRNCQRPARPSSERERFGGECHAGQRSHPGQGPRTHLVNSIEEPKHRSSHPLLASPRILAAQQARFSRAVTPPITGGLHCGYLANYSHVRLLPGHPADYRRASENFLQTGHTEETIKCRSARHHPRDSWLYVISPAPSPGLLALCQESRVAGGIVASYCEQQLCGRFLL